MTALVNLTALTLETPGNTSLGSDLGSKGVSSSDNFVLPGSASNSSNERSKDQFDSILKTRIRHSDARKHSSAQVEDKYPNANQAEAETETIELESSGLSLGLIDDRLNNSPDKETQRRIVNSNSASGRLITSELTGLRTSDSGDQASRLIDSSSQAGDRKSIEIAPGQLLGRPDAGNPKLEQGTISNQATAMRTSNSLKETIARQSQILETSDALESIKLEQNTNTLKSSTAIANLESDIRKAAEGGKLLPVSGKALPLTTAQLSIPSVTIADSKLSTTAVNPASESLILSSKESVPETVRENLPLAFKLDQLTKGLNPDSSEPGVRKFEVKPELEQSLLNSRNEQFSKRMSINPNQAASKQALAESGLDKSLFTAGIPISELFKQVISQTTSAATSRESAITLQLGQAESQSASLLANYQANSAKPFNTSSSPSGVSANANFSVPLPADHQQWGSELSSRIRWMSEMNVSSARLKLHPAELGSLEILIASEDNQTRVNFITSNAAAKDIIEATLPRLRDLLGQSGLQLEHGDVSQQESNQNDKQEHLPIHEDKNANAEVEPTLSESNLALQRKATSNLQVDHYV